MKLRIKGRDHPCVGDGWMITDENGVEVLLKSIDLHVDHHDVSLKAELYEYPDLDIELDAQTECLRNTCYAVEINGKKISMCSGHLSALRLFADKGLIPCGIKIHKYAQFGYKCMETIE